MGVDRGTPARWTVLQMKRSCDSTSNRSLEPIRLGRLGDTLPEGPYTGVVMDVSPSAGDPPKNVVAGVRIVFG